MCRVESTIRITKTKSGSTVTTTVSALHADGLGSVRAVTDGAGVAVEGTTYRPYGEEVRLQQPLTLAETKGFIGERFDDGAGLQYLNARYYDPRLGMFVQPDWWEVTGPGVGTNRYAYAFNDPVNHKDALGNRSVSVGVTGELTPGIGISGGVSITIDVPSRPGESFDIRIGGYVSGRTGSSAGAAFEFDSDASPLRSEVSALSGDITVDATANNSVFGGKVSQSIINRGTSVDVALTPEIKAKIQYGPKVGASVGLTAEGEISGRGLFHAIADFFGFGEEEEEADLHGVRSQAETTRIVGAGVGSGTSPNDNTQDRGGTGSSSSVSTKADRSTWERVKDFFGI